MSSVTDRFKELYNILLTKKIIVDATDFGKKTDISSAFITEVFKDRSGVGGKTIQKTLKAFPQINSDWLVSGSGEMFKIDGAQGNKQKNINTYLNARNNLLDLSNRNDDQSTDTLDYAYFEQLLPTPNNPNHWIPFYESFDKILAVSKNVERMSDKELTKQFPIFPNPDDYLRLPYTIADLVFMLTSDNMKGKLEKGSSVSVQLIPDKMDVTWGKMYLVIFNDCRREIYKIFPGKNEELWILRSENNEHYPDVIKKVDKILNIWEVKSTSNNW